FLPVAKRAEVLAHLCEGMSMSATARVCDVSFDAVKKLLQDAGEACLDLHNDLVQDVHAVRVQCDEVWSFNYCKSKTVVKAKAPPEMAGDVWTWTAIDADTKLIISYLVWDRSATSAEFLMRDLRSRVSGRIQLTADGYSPYRNAVRVAFGDDVDFAQLVKV